MRRLFSGRGGRAQDARRLGPAATARLHLVAVVGQYVPEPGPALLRNGDGRAEVGLHFRYAHVHAAVVLTDVEVEILKPKQPHTVNDTFCRRYAKVLVKRGIIEQCNKLSPCCRRARACPRAGRACRSARRR